MPDQADTGGCGTEEEALRVRLKLLEATTSHVRQEAQRVPTERSGNGRKYDSFTYSSVTKGRYASSTINAVHTQEAAPDIPDTNSGADDRSTPERETEDDEGGGRSLSG